MKHSAVELYSKLIQLKQKGIRLTDRKCKRFANSIAKQTGYFEPAILDLHALAVYEKDDEPGLFFFLEGEESYFYFDGILDFTEQGKLVEFGFKGHHTPEEALGYIDEIAELSGYQLNREASLMLWLANPSDRIRLEGHVFHLDQVSQMIESTTPYGQDWMLSARDDINTITKSAMQFISFWDEPRTEQGGLLGVPQKYAA